MHPMMLTFRAAEKDGFLPVSAPILKKQYAPLQALQLHPALTGQEESAFRKPSEFRGACASESFAGKLLTRD
jgi:hypothetical protein